MSASEDEAPGSGMLVGGRVGCRSERVLRCRLRIINLLTGLQ